MTQPDRQRHRVLPPTSGITKPSIRKPNGTPGCVGDQAGQARHELTTSHNENKQTGQRAQDKNAAYQTAKRRHQTPRGTKHPLGRRTTTAQTRPNTKPQTNGQRGTNKSQPTEQDTTPTAGTTAKTHDATEENPNNASSLKAKKKELTNHPKKTLKQKRTPMARNKMETPIDQRKHTTHRPD